MSDVKVSVIVPNYNHARFLDERIQSILNQDYQNFEVIILDDKSTDNSKEVIERYKNHPKVCNIVFNEENSGSTFRQWNKGLALAKGEYIWLAESDDTCDSNLLSTLVPLLDDNDKVSLAYCKTIRVDETGEVLDDLSFWYQDIDAAKWNNNYVNTGSNEIATALIKKNTIVNASAVVFRKNVALNIGTAPQDYKLSGDWLFWILLIKDHELAYSTKCTNYFRTHTRSVRAGQSNLIPLQERLTMYSYLTKNKLVGKNNKAIYLPVLRQELKNTFTNRKLSIANFFGFYKYYLQYTLLKLA